MLRQLYQYDYNLKDDDIRYFIIDKVISDKPIDFYGMKIKHINADDMLENGEKWMNRLLSPFLNNIDVYIGDTQDLDVGLLEIFCYETKNQLNKGEVEDTFEDLLIDSISYFFGIDKGRIGLKEYITSDNKYKVDLVIVDETNPIVNPPKLFMSSRMFEELKKIILLIYNDGKEFHREDYLKQNDKELTSNNANDAERLKRFYQGANAYKKSTEKDNKGKINKIARFSNVYNTVVNWACNGDYEKALKRNIYQLYSTYNFIHAESNYNYVLNISSNGMATESLKIVPLPEQVAK
jgi:hypothetical protein